MLHHECRQVHGRLKMRLNMHLFFHKSCNCVYFQVCIIMNFHNNLLNNYSGIFNCFRYLSVEMEILYLNENL